MFKKSHGKWLRAQILSKAEMNTKKYNLKERSRSNFDSTNMHPSKTLLYELDNDYSKLTPHKKIHLDHIYNISLFTYSEQFYNLQMANYIFPMRVIIKNVKNQGTMFIGYDQEYPGVYHNHQVPIFSIESLGKVKNYDFKLPINQDLVIVLKKKGKQPVKNIYFTLIAGKSLFLCDFKVQFLGLFRESRSQTLNQLKIREKSYKINHSNNLESSILAIPRFKTQKSDLGKKLKQFVHSKTSSNQNMNKIAKLQQFTVSNQSQVQRLYKNPSNKQKAFKLTNQYAIDFFKTLEILKNDKKKANSTGSFNMAKKVLKTEVDYKFQQAKRNKEMLEEYKLKDKQLRATASKCKIMIQNYKKFFNEKNVRTSKLNKDLVLSLYSAVFIKNIHKTVDYQIRIQNKMYKINYWCNKFMKKLKTTYKDTCRLVPYRSKRIKNDIISGIYLLSKLMVKKSTIKAQKITKQALVYLKPLVLMHRSLSLSVEYIHKITFIQRAWKVKYHNRLQALMHFVDIHLKKIFKQLAHFRMFSEAFYTSGSNQDICLTYIKNQNEKYRKTYQVYMQKVLSINQMMNDSQPKQNKYDGLRLPTRPLHRLFRNLDILKFMIRSWFQLEYKNFLKKPAKRTKY